ncbi:MAG: hypothetical protein H7230_04670 [Candidatus Parcubacteria bacterium]|nr:hypothetical protein [Candidatus Paceibacterota bacterium]
MANPININTQISREELIKFGEDLTIALGLYIPDEFKNQDIDKWNSFFWIIKKKFNSGFFDPSTVDDLLLLFGSILDENKDVFLSRYQNISDVNNQVLASVSLDEEIREGFYRPLDEILEILPSEFIEPFLNSLYNNQIPNSLLAEMGVNPQLTEEEILSQAARYRENGLTLSSGSRSTFANTNQAMTTEQLSALLDKMPGINQELKTQIREQPVISTKVASDGPSQSDNPFINFGDRIGRVIDSGAKTTPKENQVEATTASPSNPNRPIPSVAQRPQEFQPQRSNTNLVNQVPSRNPAQPFSLPSIPSGGSTISRLTQARRSNVSNEQIPPNQANQVEATTASAFNPAPSNPLNPQSPNSPAQILKNAIRAKKIAEANQTPQLIRPNRPPTVSL